MRIIVIIFVFVMALQQYNGIEILSCVTFKKKYEIKNSGSAVTQFGSTGAFISQSVSGTFLSFFFYVIYYVFIYCIFTDSPISGPDL